MTRYIDAGIFRGKHEVAEVKGKLSSVILYADIVNAPTADVVPKAVVWEMVERLKKRLPVISPCIFESIAKEVLEEQQDGKIH